jgi:DNA-binding transcriptional LysR family regulator
VDTLESMRAIVRVIDLGSLSAAARSLGLSPAMVTKHVAHLERRTGARLLNRTTRHVRATDAGQTYYERCVGILAGVAEAESEAGADSLHPAGTLRVTAPVEFGNAHVAPLVGNFMNAHPDLELLLDLTNRTVDLVQEGYDVALRIAENLDTALVGRRLATSRFHIVASPDYLDRHGRPQKPEDLGTHVCLTFALPTVRDEWPFECEGLRTSVKIKPRLVSTSSEALRAAAVAGAGITWLPTFVCGDDLRRGRLQSLFPQFDTGAFGVYALFPHRRFLAARVRVLIDFLLAQFQGDPDGDPWAKAARAGHRASGA